MVAEYLQERLRKAISDGDDLATNDSEMWVQCQTRLIRKSKFERTVDSGESETDTAELPSLESVLMTPGEERRHFLEYQTIAGGVDGNEDIEIVRLDKYP